MAIFGLGKLGGGELGYASDIEILFVYETPAPSGTRTSSTCSADFFERWAQEFLQWIDAKQEGIFHVDTRLRPYGDKGTLANSREEIQGENSFGLTCVIFWKTVLSLISLTP